jgi:parallel beta-helix repeat protein
MKSLDQIEPRTIVNAVNTPGDAGDMFVISQPGSYYLTTNLTATSTFLQNGIAITTNNVTLDLNGFALNSLPGTSSGTAISIPGIRSKITVRNGSINGWGLAGVLQYSASVNSYLSVNLLFEHLNISGSQDGIYASGAAVVRDCHVYNNSSDGIDCNVLGNSTIASTISGCTADGNIGDGINVNFGNVSDCTANNNESSGIFITSGNVSGCTANFNEEDGIYNTSGNVSGCIANDNVSDGIESYSCAVSGCTASGNYDEGIYANVATVSGCTAIDNSSSGIYGRDAVVAGCTASFNGNNGIELNTSATNASPGMASDCIVLNNQNNGIFVNGSGAVITGNNCDYNNTSVNSGCAGITIYFSSGNRIENNHVTGSGYAGINVSGSNNIIIKNSVTGNGLNDYLITSGQITGPFINATGIIASSNPWANFAF